MGTRSSVPTTDHLAEVSGDTSVDSAGRGPDAAPLRVRWLGTVAYQEAWSLQRALHGRGGSTASSEHLLLLEHPHTYTLGRNADPAHVLVDPLAVGAELVEADRGGDVTYHGPGQLVAYPIVSLDAVTVKDYVCLLEGALEQGRSLSAEVFFHHRDGHEVPVRIKVTPIRNQRGRVVGAVQVFTDLAHLPALLGA